MQAFICPIFAKNCVELPEVSVIIVNYNARFFLKNCLESVFAATKGLEAEVIVVDNNSSDGSCGMLHEHYPDVQRICNGENLGFSRANNQAAARARGDYLLILNPDTVLAEHTLRDIMAWFQSHPEAGAAGVSFIDGKGSFLPECKRNFPTLRIALLKVFGLSGGYYSNDLEAGDKGPVDVLTGAFMFMRRSLFEELNGFDEEFFMYGEDIDLSYRILQAGYRNYYLGENTVIHYKGESTVKDASYYRNFYGALRIFYNKHFRGNVLSRLLLPMLVEAMVLLRSFTGRIGKNPVVTCRRFVYLGQRKEVLNSLFQAFPGTTGVMITDASVIDTEADTLFLDTANSSFSELIRLTGEPGLRHMAKRLVSKDGSYCLGSDSPDSRGRVFQI